MESSATCAYGPLRASGGEPVGGGILIILVGSSPRERG